MKIPLKKKNEKKKTILKLSTNNPKCFVLAKTKNNGGCFHREAARRRSKRTRKCCVAKAGSRDGVSRGELSRKGRKEREKRERGKVKVKVKVKVKERKGKERARQTGQWPGASDVDGAARMQAFVPVRRPRVECKA